MSILQAIYRRLGIVRYHLSRTELVIVVWAGVLVILVGTVTYSLLEGWSWLDSLYATVITITTIGYGDLSPQTQGGRLFAIFFSIIAIGIAGYGISVLAAYVIEKQATRLERVLRKRKMERIDALNDHMIICGTDYVGFRIAREFQVSNTPFILIESDKGTLKSALLTLIPEYYQGKLKSVSGAERIDLSVYEDRTISEIAEMAEVPFLIEDPTDDHVLVQAGIERAAGVVAVLPDDRDNLSIVVGARALANRLDNKSLRIMSRVESAQYVRKLHFSGADDVRAPASIGASEMALHMANPEIGQWWYENFTGAMDSPRYFQVDISAKKPEWVGKSVGDVHANENTLLLAVKRGKSYLSPPPHNEILLSGDIGIVFGRIQR